MKYIAIPEQKNFGKAGKNMFFVIVVFPYLSSANCCCFFLCSFYIIRSAFISLDSYEKEFRDRSTLDWVTYLYVLFSFSLGWLAIHFLVLFFWSFCKFSHKPVWLSSNVYYWMPDLCSLLNNSLFC